MWCKITNKNEKHYDHQYVDGLNVLKEEFNNNPKDVCVAGGFYFTKLDYINSFLEYGCWLREIELPENDPDFKIIKVDDEQQNKWRANKIILGKRHSIYDIDVVKKFKLNASAIFKKLVHDANYDLIKKWLESDLGFEPYYVTNIMQIVPYNVYYANHMSNNDRADILELLLTKFGSCMIYDTRAIVDNIKCHAYSDSVTSWWVRNMGKIYKTHDQMLKSYLEENDGSENDSSENDEESYYHNDCDSECSCVEERRDIDHDDDDY